MNSTLSPTKLFVTSLLASLLTSLCLAQDRSPAPTNQAQETQVLSQKPYITQTFDPARNETEVRVSLAINYSLTETSDFRVGEITGTISGPNKGARTQSGLILGYANHIYEGRTPTGKRSGSFTFYSKRKDTFNDQAAFSIIVDGKTIQDGMAESPIQLSSKGDDYKQKIILLVPIEIFLRIANAKKVQFKIGPNIYELEGFQQKSIRALADTIDLQKK